MIEKKIHAQSMTRDAFRKSAVALAHHQVANVWQVFLGHDLLGDVIAESAMNAVDEMHMLQVQRALIKCVGGKPGKQVSELPSSAALADYPAMVVRYPRVVWMVLDRERRERDGVLSKERLAIAGLVDVTQQLMTGRATKKGIGQMVSAALKPAQAILQSNPEVSERELALEKALRNLLDGFDAGGITGGQEMFELARSFVESSGVPTFSTWMAGVEQCMPSQAADAYALRHLYDMGLSPHEAVLVDRMGSGATQH